MSEEITRFDQKLEHILRTSAGIFAQKSFHATSMRDIAAATGVSLAGLYHYCKSKEELLCLIQENSFRRVLESARERLKQASTPVEKLHVFIENHLSFFAANMAEMKVLSHEADSLSDELAEGVTGIKQQYTKLARRILTEVHNADSQTGPAVDITVATYALFGMMNWIYNWYDPAGKLSVAQLVDNLSRLFLNGYSSDLNQSKTVLPNSMRTAGNLSVWRSDRIED
jgi:AcrR family transcriptional regulator